MSVTVTRTKILLPRRRPDLLSRPRLLNMLNDILDFPFTLISAPAGYGKTSLLIDLAHQGDFPICWFSIDDLDQDPKRFLVHLLSSIQSLYPDFGSASLSLIDNVADPFSIQDQLVGTIVNEIFEAVSEHFVIILDDFHFLGNHKGINNFISRLGQEMDDNTHLVIASRTLFNFPDLPLLIGRRMVKGIGFDDLAFQTEELKDYYQNYLQRSITDEESRNLIANTEGWITGLLLSANITISALAEQKKAELVTGANLFGYLADQVFEIQSGEIQDFLLHTSLFEEFNEALCDQTLGKPSNGSWGDKITYVLQHNLFVQQVEDNGTWLRYHHLFKDFLQNRFHTKFPDKKADLLIKLLKIYRGNSSWENAYYTALSLGDPTALAEVIEQASSPLFHEGRINLLASWLETLPEAGFEAYPQLYVLQGFTSTKLGKPELGLNQLDKAIKHPLIKANPNQLALSYTWRATANRFLGQYKEALKDGLLVKTLPGFATLDKTSKAEAYREIGLAYGRLGDTKETIKYLKASHNLYKSVGRPKNDALVQMDLGYAYLKIGSLIEAHSQFENSLLTWQSLNIDNQLAVTMNNLGNLSILRGDYKVAYDWINRAVHHAKETNNHRIQAISIASLGDLACSLSEFKVGLEYYIKARDMAEEIQEGFLLSYLELSLAATYRYRKEMTTARDHLSTAHTFILQNTSRNELGLWYLEKGFQELESCAYPGAQAAFSQADEIFQETNQPFALTKANLGLGFVCQRLGNQAGLLENIRKCSSALQILETTQPLLAELNNQSNNFSSLMADIDPDSNFIQLQGDINNYQHNLLSLQKEIFPKINLKPDQEPCLNIQALGKNRVSYQGKLINKSEWIHQKTVRELFFYLLTQPDGVSKDQIGIIFWPDSSPGQLTCQFKNAIYRLRRAVGREIIHYDPIIRTYRFNKDLDYRYDVDIFLAAYEKAEKEKDRNLQIAQYCQAVSLYRHPYAPQLDGVWAEPTRRSLYLKYEKALLIAAAHELAQGQYQACINNCQNLLDIEPCQETAYQLSIKAYSKIGDRTGLVRIYQACQENFDLYIGIPPSAKTVSLYQELSK